MEQTVDGTFTVSFTTYPDEWNNNPGYDILTPESTVTVDNYNFVVKQFDDTGFSKRIMAVSEFFEHSKTHVGTLFEGAPTISALINFALAQTGWNAVIDVDISGVTSDIGDFGNDSAVSLINKLCQYHEIEYVIMSNKTIRFSKKIGPDNDYQYRYKNNISGVVLMEDTTNLYTYIRGYGAEGLEVVYESPNISVYGKKEHPPFRDEEITDANILMEKLKRSINDIPELTIESTIPELTSRETGERVWLIYPPLKTTMQTRVIKQVKVIRNKKLVTDSVTLGNTLFKTSVDGFIEQREELEDKFQKDLFLQWRETEERIIDQYNTITSEYNASISVSAREIRTEMSQKEVNINNTIGAQYTKITSEYNSSISQTAQAIRQEVTASITKVNGDILEVEKYASRIEQSANQIQQTVSSQQIQINGQSTRISNAESSITQQSYQIQSKVSQTDYNGRTISSLINQDAYSVSIDAGKINFNGHVFGQGSTWSGDISTSANAYVGNNLYLAPNGGGSKSIVFDNVARIVGDWSNISISAPNVKLDGNGVTIGTGNGTVDFNGRVNFAYAELIGVARAESSGIGFSTSGGNLYVKVFGSTVGTIKMT